MKSNLLLKMFFIVSSPLILILIIFLLFWTYFKFIEPVIMNIKFAPNREKLCIDRADPVRFSINDIEFRVPADYFDLQDITRCWGEGFYGYVRGCSKNSQSKKEFINSTSKRSNFGYCQGKDDDPFLLDRFKFKLDEYHNENSIFRLTAINKPEIRVNLPHIILDETSHATQREYCTERGQEEQIKIFGNPVFVTCFEKILETGKEEALCSYRAKIEDKVDVLTNEYFKISDIPPEYWLSYFGNIENLLQNILVEKPKPSYPEMCKKFKAKRNDARDN